TQRAGRRRVLVRPRLGSPRPKSYTRHVHRVPAAPRLNDVRKEAARPQPDVDVTLRLRRVFISALFGAARSGPGRFLIASALRAAMPPVARLAGEELLCRPRKVLAFTAHP